MKHSKRNVFKHNPDGTMRKIGVAPIPLGNDEREVPNYKIRRAASVGTVALTALLGLGIMHWDDKGDRPPESPIPTTIVTADPGDTIWGLQSREGTMPDKDMGQTVYEVVGLNGSPTITPGQSVILYDGPKSPKQ
jgi:hypothetical protein